MISSKLLLVFALYSLVSSLLFILPDPNPCLNHSVSLLDTAAKIVKMSNSDVVSEYLLDLSSAVACLFSFLTAFNCSHLMNLNLCGHIANMQDMMWYLQTDAHLL